MKVYLRTKNNEAKTIEEVERIDVMTEKVEIGIIEVEKEKLMINKINQISLASAEEKVVAIVS